MSFGVLGTRGAEGFGKPSAGVRRFGFGAAPCVTPPPSQIPGSCWDKALDVPKINFKDCHAAAFRVAQDACKRRGEDNLCCINRLADQYAREMCADVCPEIMTSGITAREGAEEPSDTEQSSLLPVVLVGLAIVAGLSLIGGKR